MANPLDLYEPDQVPASMVQPAVPDGPHSSATGAFGRSAALSVAPTAGGLAAAVPAAEAGGGLGALIGSVVPGAGTGVGGVIGGVLGGAAGALGGGWIVDAAQTRLIHAFPRTAAALGIDDASRAADQAQHPTASFIGSNAAALAFLKPSWAGWKQALVGGGINAGIQAGQELYQTGTVDPLHVAVAAAVGGVLSEPNRLGAYVTKPGTWAVERIATGAGRTQAEQGAADTIAQGLAEARAPAMGRDLSADADALAAARGEHLTPDEQAAIHVARDAAVTRGTSPFQPGPAGDQEHGLRLAATMQAMLDDTPLPPIGAETAAHAAGTDFAPIVGTAGVKARIAQFESGAKGYAAHNPQPGQTASGKYQFTDPTWLGVNGKGGFAREVFPGKSDAELRALKADPAAQEAVMDHAMASYARGLQSIGAPATPGNLYLLHFLGPKGLDVLRADAATPVEALLPAKAIAANRAWLQGKSAGELVQDMAARGGGTMTPSVYVDHAQAAAAAGTPIADNDLTAFLYDQFAQEHAGDIAAETQRRATLADDAAAEAAMAPAIEKRTARKPVRSGPIDVATFLADHGGIADAEGHDLVQGRNLQQRIPGAGNLIKPSGMSIDAAGLLLHDHGYFGPPSTSERPTPAQVLDLLEETRGRKVYSPEGDEQLAAEAASRPAPAPEMDDVRSHIASRAEEMGLAFDDADVDHASQQVLDGAVPGTAIERTIAHRFDEANSAIEGETGAPYYEGDGDGLSGDEPFHWPTEDDVRDAGGREPSGSDAGDEGAGGAIGGEPAGVARLAGEATGDSVALERFDHADGEGAEQQIESLEHDLRMDVFHGSPHTFERFSTSHIGSGEGAQAFGHGLYFTDNPGLAEKYRRDLTKVYDAKHDVIDYWVKEAGGDWKKAGELYDAYAKDVQIDAGEIGEALRAGPAGKVYTVSIPQGAKYLLWDKPFADQPPTIARALKAALGEDASSFAGDALYDRLADKLGSAEAASKYLNQAGGAGIKYLAGDSRRQGDGNFNYVVFSDSDVHTVDQADAGNPASKPDLTSFRLDPEGAETTLADALAVADADEAAAGHLRACLPAKVEA